MYPTKLLITIACDVLSSKLSLRYCFPLFPKRNIASPFPAFSSAILSSIAREAFHDSSDMGFTIPVVPNIDIPPIIPSFAFNVFFAVSSPLGTDISTSAPNPSGNISSTVSLIIFKGTGFIAEFPGATGSPFLVTFPTPVPPKIFIFESFRKLTFE